MSYGPHGQGDPGSHRGDIQQREAIMAISEEQLTLDIETIEADLEQQVADYFSDWEVDDLDDPNPAPYRGRIVYA